MTDTFYAPRFEVRIEGLTLAADVTNQVISLTYDNNVDLADMFSLVMRNHDNALTDSALFDLGKTVEIHLGYGGDLKPVMLGEITSIEPAFPQAGPPTLSVTGYDKSYRLRHNQPQRDPFQYMDDSSIASLIAAEAGLIPVVDPSFYFHEYIQQTGSDMAFLKERAEANFFDVYVYWDKLYFQLPRPQLEAVALGWGQNLSSFSPRLATAAVAGLQVVRGWDEKLANTVVGFATSLDVNPQDLLEKLGSNAQDILSNLGRRLDDDQNVDTQQDAATLAKSLLQQILDGMYEGSGTCIGQPDLRAGQIVDIKNVGRRFSGKYRLKRVTHTIDDSGYSTHFEVTQKSGAGVLPLLRKLISETPSPNKQKRYNGVAVGKVTRNKDPESRGRVKLSFPWFSDGESAWARCTTPMSGGSRGAFFLPDVGDEVLVSFQHGDIRKPVVVGSLWNGKDLPPTTNSDGANAIRMIKTKAGHSLTFDDTKGKEQIVIHHSSGSEIKMKSNGDIEITPTGSNKVKLAGGGDGVVRKSDGVDCGTLIFVPGTSGAQLQYVAPGGTVNVPSGGSSIGLSGAMKSASNKVESG